MIFTAMSDGRFDLGGRWCDCALGREGVVPAAEKREGDGCSPLGVWPVRRVLYRPDSAFATLPALTTLGVPCAPIAPDDGWCDAPGDPRYNRPVKLPYPASAERMWRDDHLYDIVVVLGHNDDPVTPLMGSAIFLHLAKPDYSGTEGCVALQAGDMIELLSKLQEGSAVSIVDAYPHPMMAAPEQAAALKPGSGLRPFPRAKQG
ncbi:MAG TPA: L,D-transpeptidase family protein [Phenylobacterium sp.]|nr:L,D-transpeptidase family protein [Phenylobacterium sp.]